jgi:DNA-binding transcriptional ArsR family regulator
MTSIGTIETIRVSHDQEVNTAVFNALSDPIRRAIVERLAKNGSMTVGALSEPFHVSAPAISRHLKVLEAAGLVSRSVDRQWRVCKLEMAGLVMVRHWLNDVVTPNHLI